MADRSDPTTMSVTTANAVYDALITHGGAPEDGRRQFVRNHLTRFCREDRVVRALGPGGKFRRNPCAQRPDGTYGEHWFVDGYKEDYTDARRTVIATLAPILDALRVQHEAEQDEQAEQAEQAAK